MNPQPHISIIVPIYKAENTLKMCLDSIKDQTYTHYEVILVNDGSPDSCEEICRSYVDQDSRFRYIYKTNGGLSDARNKGLELACGEYIMFLDSDDALSKYTLEYLSAIIAQTSADIVSFEFTYDDRQLNIKPPFHCDGSQLIKDQIIEHYFLKEVAVTNRIFNAKLLEDIHFVKGQISEDVLYLYKCYQKAASLYKTNYPFYFYNQEGTNSITRSGLSVADHSSVDANVEMMNLCRTHSPSYQHLAKLQYLKSIFNIINKSVVRGFRDEAASLYYKNLIPMYSRELKKNLQSILKSKSFSKNDKIQILVLSLSFKGFVLFKKTYIRCKK